jgi:hypothetical protein
MSLLTSIIPLPWRIGIVAALVIGAAIWLRVEWQHSVKLAADKVINQYIATKKKDDEQLAAIETKTNTKIQIQYVDRIVTVTKIVKQNVPVIQLVPDTKTVLSDGWINAYNAIVQGIAIDPQQAQQSTPSGVSAVDALEVENTNYGICLQYKATAQGLQDWVNQTKANVVAENKKAK